MAAALAANFRTAVGTPAAASDELRITVYDEAHLPPQMLFDALDRLRLILRQAKITSHPVLGDPATPEASLFMYVSLPRGGEELQIACGARRDIAVKIGGSSPGSLAHTVLGMSSPFAPFGLNVRIFDDHIREAALQHDLSGTIVLSYAMAHEIGHVLLRSCSHGEQGIMSPIWTKREYDRMNGGALVFSDDEAMKMSANFRAPVCRLPDRRFPIRTEIFGGIPLLQGRMRPANPHK